MSDFPYTNNLFSLSNKQPGKVCSRYKPQESRCDQKLLLNAAAQIERSMPGNILPFNAGF